MTPSMPESRHWGRALLVFAVCTVIFIWPWIIGDSTIPGASKSQFFPDLLFIAQSWFRGESASWNPYLFAGHPQIADYHGVLLTPYTLLAALDSNPGTRAFDAMTFLFLFLGGTGMIFFGRLNRWHWVASTISALTFMFGGAAIWRIDETGLILAYSLLPLALLYLEFTLRRKNYIYAVVAGVLMTAVLLTRNHLAVLAAALFIARTLWFLLAPPWRAESFRRTLLPALTAFVVCAALSFMPILYTIGLLKHVGPAGADTGAALIPLHFLTFVVPNLFSSSGALENFWGPPSANWPDAALHLSPNMLVLYAGALPVLLMGLIFYPCFWRGRGLVFCFAILFFAFAYALGAHGPIFNLLQTLVPGLRYLATPVDAALFGNVLIAFVTGYLLNVFLTFRANPAALLITGSAILLGSFWLAWVTAQEQGQIIGASPALLLSAVTFAIGVFVLLLSRNLIATWPSFGAGLLIVFVLIDLRLHNGPNSSNAAARETYALLDAYSENPALNALKEKLSTHDQNHLDRFALQVTVPQWQGVSSVHRFFDIGVRPVIALPWVSEILSPSNVGDKIQKFMQLLGLRTTVFENRHDATTKSASQDPSVLNFGSVAIKDADGAFPRLWMASDAVAVTDRAAFQRDGLPALDFAHTVLLENAPAQLPHFNAAGSASFQLYRQSEIEIETQRTEGGYLVLADAWHPWWDATIDNKPTRIYRANLLMRAVIIPAGSHVVRFSFNPVCGALREFGLSAFCKS